MSITDTTAASVQYNDRETDKVLSARRMLRGLTVTHVDPDCIYLDNGYNFHDKRCIRARLYTDVNSLEVWHTVERTMNYDTV